MDDSPLYQYRRQHQPKIPSRLLGLKKLSADVDESVLNSDATKRFPNIGKKGKVFFQKREMSHRPLRVGVVLSGGQAPGGHDVIAGLFDGLKILHPDSQLIGFLGGPSGIVNNETLEITHALLVDFRNTGGFNLIGSGRTKIETPEQFAAVETTAKANHLDGLVIIGGDDSNTNAALLAEKMVGKLTVIGVPKTIDGDLKGYGIEASFGFDTASKVYSGLIGNVEQDALSAKKYYFFIKLMGRSASHLTLEAALQTRPNLTFISEEVAAQNLSLAQVTEQIADLIEERNRNGKNFGVILIPEGLVEFIPEFRKMIQELNHLLANEGDEKAVEKLSLSSKSCFTTLPDHIKKQLLLERDPHGNVQVSKIDTERLLIATTQIELKKRGYQGPFSGQPLFFGYEGRSAYPSNFDVNYCYNLGQVASLLVDQKYTGYMAGLQELSGSVEEWVPVGIPIASMITLEERHGKEKPVIEKALVDLTNEPFRSFSSQRQNWRLKDHYRNPGPIQYFGDATLTEATTKTLQLENLSKKALATPG